MHRADNARLSFRAGYGDRPQTLAGHDHLADSDNVAVRVELRQDQVAGDVAVEPGWGCGNLPCSCIAMRMLPLMT